MSADPSVFEDLHRHLVEQLNGLTSGDQWLGWLQSARLFHRYSPQNQMLLRAQGADGHVASYRTWQRIPAEQGGNCQVAKGERGLMILAPLIVTHREIDEVTGDEIAVGSGIRGFKPVKVFHQGQLVSPPSIPEQPLPELLTGENRWQHVWSAVQSHLGDLGYDIELHARNPFETWNGRTDFLASQVFVVDHLEPPQQLKTLIHEWAHIALGHDDLLATVSRDVLEVEAESVAFLVCSTIGLNSSAYSVPYLASWSNGDTDLVERTAQRVLAHTASMVSILERELSIDLTPDLLTASNPTSATLTVLADRSPEVPLNREIAPIVIATLDQAADPTVDNAPPELRPFITTLDPADRQLLLDALAHLDRDLDIATGLMADAGIEAATATQILSGRGVEPRELYRSMTRHVTDSSNDGQRTLFADVVAPQSPRQPDTAHCVAVELLDHLDRKILDRMDLTQRDQVVTAARILPTLDGVDAAAAVDILGHYGAIPTDIEYALRCLYYQPSSSLVATNWPEADIDAVFPPSPGPSRTRAASRDEIPLVGLVRTVAESNDPRRIAALADALDLGYTDAVSVCADAGINPAVAADAALLRRHGNLEQAANDLALGWTEPLDGPWSAYLPTPTSPLNPAEAILAQWAALSAPSMVTVPEIP